MTENERRLMEIIRNAKDPEALIEKAFLMIIEQMKEQIAESKSFPADLPSAS